jgi:hypothetical protein
MRIILFIALLGVFACQTGKNESLNSENSNRTVLKPCIQTSVLLKDTMRVMNIDKDLSIHEVNYMYNKEMHYLMLSEFNELKKNIWQLIKKPDYFVYSDLLGNPLTSKELRDKFIMCDSISEEGVDAKGNVIEIASYVCDSISRFESISKINFFETWYVNKSTNLIEKEVIGYQVLSFDSEKEAYRELFFVVRNEEAKKTLLKYFGE